MDERLESFLCLVYYQVSGEPGCIQTFTSGDVDLCAHLFVDHCRIIFFACLIFVVGLDSEIILTAKFSRSRVTLRQK